jgi:chlorite dismutase
MFGCTYTTGREQDPNDWLLRKPRRAALRPDWPWAVWYPLRRKPEFALLSREEQGRILAEHGMVGSGYIDAGVAADIRLSCYGLDKNDNEFIIGLTGPELYPLSSLVQEMRRTQHTAKYIQTLGPFFIGRAYWQSAAPAS